MTLVDEAQREIGSIWLGRWGRVVPSDGVVPWLVVDEVGDPVEPIHGFLREFVARGRSAGSVRSYALALHRWWRFLRAIGVEWDMATSVEVRDFVLWLRNATKTRSVPRTKSTSTAGRVNL
jgi:integrase/recombinase XerD